MFAGGPSAEAVGVLKQLGIHEVISWISPGSVDWDDVVLVDCHHPAQLPHVGNFDAVSVVIDHHPDGNVAAFPNASIQNEEIGAAATLVAERVIASSLLSSLEPPHAALLAAAIASNTLDFVAPSTTDRDHTAFAALAARASPVVSLDDLLSAMKEWRQGFLSLTTLKAIEADCKLIETPRGQVAVSQLEGDDARLLADRPDMFDCISELVASTGAVTGVVSLVDTATGTTTLLTEDEHLQRLLMSLDPVPLRPATLVLPFIALRKTHIIPALVADGSSI